MWDLFHLEAFSELPEEEQESPGESSEQLFLALSSDAQRGSHGRQTIQFNGSIHGLSITVLINPGSSASFLAASVAAQLPQLHCSPMNASVKVANGHLLHCTSVIMGCVFSLGEYQFQHDLRILPLESYDLILGIDWLELYSPMEVHWKSKWLSIPCNGETVLLQGITAGSNTDLVNELLTVEMSDSEQSAIQLPEDIAALLAEFPQVFTVPSSLLPKRACDHAIPLVTGATPVNIRAYRYPPSLKDEIERQVTTKLD